MQLTKNPDVEVPPFRFVPETFDPADAGALEAIAGRLLEREIGSVEDLKRFVYDWSEIGARVWGEWARRLTAMNRDTRDAGARERNNTYQREIQPAWQRHDDRLTRRYLESPFRKELGPDFEVFDRDKAKDAEIYREENTELAAQDQLLSNRYQEIQGNVTVELDGETLTKEQCAARLQATDRAAREKAWRALADRMARERDEIDQVFDELVKLRHQMARNAGFEDYVEFRFAEKHRFDYTPEDCARYHDAVARVAVPVLREIRALRQSRLGLDSLRPWDLDVSPFGTEPRTLFEDQAGYVALLQRIFCAVDPVFEKDFDVLVRNDMLDLMSRPGKAPGGYNCPIDDIRLPFIFFNAVGRRGDLRVLLHEGGHAFHTLAARDNPVEDYRSAPAEFAEAASMAMELFGLERLGEVLEPEEVREFAFGQFEGILNVFSMIACGDAFQAWVYTHPDHGRDGRRDKWVELIERFQPGIDYSGLEEHRARGWQRVLHFFSHPLYFIEYAIAQIGALQMWRLEREDHDAAVAGYRRALALGGSRPLPQLFQAAGIRFAMDESVLRDLVPDVMQRLQRWLAE